MVKKNNTYFVTNTYQTIFIPYAAYKRIKPFIETAVVYRYYGYVCIEYRCFHMSYPLIETFVNYQSVQKQELCDTCIFRLEEMVGTCDHQFRLLDRVDTRDFQYLVEKMNELGMVQDEDIRLRIDEQLDQDEGYYDGYHDFSTWESIVFFVIFLPFLAFALVGYKTYKIIDRGVLRPLKSFWR